MSIWTDEQLEAINKSGTNIIVSAGAGSGKTAVLTERVINKLKNGIHINELLILTFTKAAAEEMKDRIRKAIKENSELKEELQFLDSSYITTFDSFSLSVVKKYHYKLNISHNIGITEDTIILMKKKELINQIFEELYKNEDKDFAKLIYDFCIKDDLSLKTSILNIADKIALLPNVEEYLDTYMSTYFGDMYINSIIAQYYKLLLDKKEEVFEELENFSFFVPREYFIKVSEALEPLRQATDISHITCKFKIPPVPRNSDEQIKNAKEKLVAKLDALSNYSIYGDIKEIKENILLTESTLLTITKILKDYFKRLKDYKRQNNIYDFQDIALLAIEVVKNNPDVREELKNSFKEIMIDEYQDTNDIQEMFISLISNNNVYMVGDIKQSIYRFRNANPNIFKNKYDHYKLKNGGIKIDLLKNFRSRREVLENINTIFNYIMDDYLGGANYTESHQMDFGNKSYEKEGYTSQNYNMEFLEYSTNNNYTKDEIEIFAIGRDILQKINSKYQIFDKKEKKLHDATFNDFVILMDRGKKFELYKKIFEYLGIPLSIYKDEKINDGYDLYVIKNLIDIVIHLYEQNFDTKFAYDFTSLARSYLYKISDDEIFNYFVNKNFKDSIIYKELIDIANTINTKTTYQILVDLINKTDLYNKLTTTNDIDNSMIKITKLLEIASSLGNIGYDIYAFNEYLGNLIEDKYDMKYSTPAINNNAVKIMTIHKSKGLEYNICYFSGLDTDFNIKEITEKFTFSNNYGIITPLFKDGIRETIFKELLKEDYYLEEISEKIRLFYVAVTRAKEKMIFLIPEQEYLNVSKNEMGVIKNSVRKKYRSFMDIILSIKKELNSYIKKINVDDLNIDKNYLYNKESNFSSSKQKELLNVEEININVKEITKESYSKKLHEIINQDQHNNIAFGLEIHETLELLDFKNPNLNLISNNFVKNKIMKFLQLPLLKNINNAIIYKEYEFVTKKDDTLNHGIIDLMIEYNDYIDIIDYKLSNILDENYLNQLNGYKEYINSITDKKVEIYLYSFIGEELKKIS